MGNPEKDAHYDSTINFAEKLDIPKAIAIDVARKNPDFDDVIHELKRIARDKEY